jgi:hypothetical protein
MIKEPKETHEVSFWKLQPSWPFAECDTHTQVACGKTDLFNIIRSAMKDGFTHFKIITKDN